MTPKDKILEKLILFDYNYVDKSNQLIINLDFSHQISIDFNNDKIIITDKLIHWNFLTGGISMSLKNAMIYSFIGINLFILLSIFGISDYYKLNIIPLFMGYIVWVLLFTIYYSAKKESFIQLINLWLNESVK